MESKEIMELLLALIAGGVITSIVKAFVDRKKVDADAKKTKAEGDVTLIEIALKMTDRFQQSINSLEIKTENLMKNNLKLEQELVEIRSKNLFLSQEIQALKIKNTDLDHTCEVLMRENTKLKSDLDNCIKKE